MKSFLLRSLRIPRSRVYTILTVAIVLTTLLAVRKVLGLPKPFVITLGLTLLGWLLVIAALRRGRKCSISRCVAELLLPWGAISFLLLSLVHYVDRGGWIWYQVSGYNGAVAEELEAEVSISPAEFVRRNQAFVLDPTDATRIVLQKGEHTILRTVIVPKGSVLTIEPGTIVRMGVGRSLISYSPIVACGTPSEPIVFTAHHRLFKWGAIGLVDTGRTVFKHVRFEHARQAVVNGIGFPGGLSAITTDVEIRNCQFMNMFGKDAIYVRQAHTLIQDNRVEGAFKDGIDLDGASGKICNNLLIDCDDEGIDLSDNFAVEVQHNTIRDRHGGRIAADHDLARIRLANTLEKTIQ